MEPATVKRDAQRSPNSTDNVPAVQHREKFCTFKVGHLYFGIEVHRVQEVIRYQHMTHVPCAPSAVRGLMNLRGQIVPALDLRRCLDLPEPPEEIEHMNVVVRTTSGSVSLLVDEIGDVLEMDLEQYETPPETLQGVARGLVRGAQKLDDTILLILDTDRVVHAEGTH